MYLRAFMLSLQSLSDRRILAILLKSAVVTALVFVMLGIGAWFGTRWMLSRYIQDSGDIAALIAFAIMVITGWVLWRAVAVAVIWFFSDDIVDAIERRHYPARAQTGRRPDIRQSVQMALRSLGRVIGYNVLALPIYIPLLFTGVGTPIAFVIVNGILLGRDLQDMLLARHGQRGGNDRNDRKHSNDFGAPPIETHPFDTPSFDTLTKGSWFLIGLLGTAAMLLPFVNLLVPVVACAMAVHMMHLKSETQKYV